MESYALKYRKYAFGGLLLITLVLTAIVMTPFYPALMWATVLSVLSYPIHKRLKARVGDILSATLTTLLIILVVGVPVVLVGTMLTIQISSFAGEIANTTTQPTEGWNPKTVLVEVERQIEPIAQRLGARDLDLPKWYEDNQRELQRSLGSGAIRAIQAGAFSILTLVFAFTTMFFMLLDGHRLREPALELMPVSRKRAGEILERMQQTIFAVFIGVVLVAVLQGTLAGISYFVAGVPNAFLWTIASIVLASIPLIGAPFVYVPLSVMLFAQGKWWEGGLMLAFCAGVVSNIDNFIRPFVIGSRVGLHPIAIFFSLIGGVLAVGPVGIMAGPILLTVLLALQEIIRDHLNGRNLLDDESDAEPAKSLELHPQELATQHERRGD